MRFGSKRSSFFCCVFFKAVLEYSYVKGCMPAFDYTGITIDVSVERLVFSWVFAIVIFAISCFKIKYEYLWFVNMFFVILSYAPTMAIWGVRGGLETAPILATALFIALMVLGCLTLQSFMPNAPIDEDDTWFFSAAQRKLFLQRRFPLIRLTILFSLIFAALLNRVYANGEILLSFENSLTRRLIMREVYMPTIPRYLYFMLGASVLPLLFSLCLYLRKYVDMALCFFAALFLYSINGMKTWIAMYPLVLALYFCVKFWATIPAIVNAMLCGLGSLWILGTQLYQAGFGVELVAYFHRIEYLPAELHFYYYDFFKTHQFLFLRDSVGRFIASSPYAYPVSRLIGMIYYGSSYMNCSNGMFSDFYSNFGYAGLFLYPMVIYGAFYFLFKAMRGTGRFVTLSAVVILAMPLYDNTLFTWALTCGYLLILIFIPFMKRRRLIFKAGRLRNFQ